MISAARELVARFAGVWPRWRDPYPPHPAEHDARVEAANPLRDLVAVLSELVEADTPRPASVVSRPKPDDAPPPMTDPSVGDKPYAGFMPPHLDPEGPFGHLPTGEQA